ncbi:QacE family quaternary ammonium compound efflux SMR transporter [Vagococcus penaei]|uniref:QacE family quaternary ammonium compound efflux SMR transporter n=1 Tax=Vagococcus penaei TaxID=633807 RepID=A0A1Q2D3B8_9ENTE|nr:multidrug efflux SMR transporter [Vagococcus penaei]AQP52827.1 QacE family quaternary ammonium compound efflux SMR transporter [Vagococcus penaei]RSU01168.1 QacE family quaternary ammonium compound efflux SMR transporter [Vagococcus penaei]
MVWVSLIFAGIFEMLGVNAINAYLKQRKLIKMVPLVGFFLLSFICLNYSMNTLPMSTAYAVWTGIGASGGAILGIILYGEPKNAKRLFFIGLILVSAIGLKIIS